jgi:hAT family C-terminal dimerisation region
MPSDIKMSDSNSSVADAKIFLDPAIAATVTPRVLTAPIHKSLNKKATDSYTREVLGLKVDDKADEFNKYNRASTVVSDLNAFNPIDWWTKAQSDFPTLHLWAFDTLAILVMSLMSVECERIFSSIKKLITPERNRLHEQIIEASECLKN